MNSDPVYVAMLQSGIPEIREIWEKVLAMRGSPLAGAPFNPRWLCANPPDLDELWTLAKEKAKADGYYGVQLTAFSEGVGLALLTPYDPFLPRLGDVKKEHAALVAFVVGKPWQEGGWKE
jgi:hypothetical protein